MSTKLTKFILASVVSTQIIACSNVNFATSADTEKLQAGQGSGVTVEPSLPLLAPELEINNGDEFTRSRNVDITLNATFTKEMYITNDSTCASGGQWVDYVAVSSWELGQLNTEVAVYAKVRYETGDESACVSDVIIHDSLAPEISITSGPKDPTNATQAEFTFESDDPSATFWCKLDNAAQYESCETGIIYSGLTEERAYTFRVYAVDPYNNASAVVSYTWSIDTTAPTAVITSGPEGQVKDLQATFTFESNDPSATFACRLNEASDFEPCESGLALNQGLAEGANTFEVVAIDEAGNQSVNPASRVWIIDNTAPQIVIISAPQGTVLETSALITYAVTEQNDLDLSTLACELNGAEIPCPILNTVVVDPAQDGENTLVIKIADLAGNLGVNTVAWEVIAEDPVCHDDNFVQPQANESKKLDILFVFDTSGSLDDERSSVKEGIIDFLLELDADTDFSVAILPAHVSSPYAGKLYKRGTEPRVLKSADGVDDLLDDLAYKINGTNNLNENMSDGGEAGLFALEHILKGGNGDNLQNAKNAGFFRQGAGLAVVFISDENAICARYPSGVTPVPDENELPSGETYEERAFRLHCENPDVTQETVYQALKEVKGNDPLVVSGIVYTDPNSVPSGFENEVGYGYIETIELNDGIAVDLAQPNAISNGLSLIGEFTKSRLDLQTEFLLTQSPVDENSIEVKVDDVVVPFSFQAPNIIQIDEDNAGSAESEIAVSYCLEE